MTTDDDVKSKEFWVGSMNSEIKALSCRENLLIQIFVLNISATKIDHKIIMNVWKPNTPTLVFTEAKCSKNLCWTDVTVPVLPGWADQALLPPSLVPAEEPRIGHTYQPFPSTRALWTLKAHHASLFRQVRSAAAIPFKHRNTKLLSDDSFEPMGLWLLHLQKNVHQPFSSFSPVSTLCNASCKHSYPLVSIPLMTFDFCLL